MTSPAGTRTEAPRADRRRAMAPSTLRARDRQATDVTVIDLSTTGIRIKAEVELEVGEEISIGLAGVGARRAFVAWTRGGELGCAFLQPLEPQEAARAFAQASVVRLGTGNIAAETPGRAGQIELEALYGRHSLWRLPADAIAVIAGYLMLFGWGVWRMVGG